MKAGARRERIRGEKQKNMKPILNGPGHHNTEANDMMRLDLSIFDANIIKYLSQFSEEERHEKVLEALRVGIVAIQSASPSLDSRVVEEKFRMVENNIDTFLTGFQGDLKTKLEEYFKSGSGSLPRSLDSLLGSDGTMARVMNSYFTADGGKLQRLIQDQVGPGSSFARSLDPNNKESVLSKLEAMVQSHLQLKTKEIVDQFSLDIGNSALSRLQKSLFDKVNEIQNTNTVFFGELKKALGIKEGKEAESEKGTEKGREFETDLYTPVAAFAKSLGDSSENVRSIVGSVERRKVGDYVITMGETSGAPGSRITIEVKKEKTYKLKDAVEELKGAKENREADAGIFAFAKGCEPVEVGDFYKLGNDFYVTVDEEALANNEPLLFLETAYKIIRTQLVTSKRIQEAKEIDKEKIKADVVAMIELTKRISDIQTKASTIKNNSLFILETCDSLKTDLDTGLNKIMADLM